MSAAGNNAKLAFSCAWVYTDESEAALPDGIYCGSFYYNTAPEPQCSGTPADLDSSLKLSMGGDHSGMGYYIIIIGDNTPVQSYYSKDKYFLSFASQLAAAAEKNRKFYGKPLGCTGGYPMECADINAPMFKNELSELPLFISDDIDMSTASYSDACFGYYSERLMVKFIRPVITSSVSLFFIRIYPAVGIIFLVSLTVKLIIFIIGKIKK